MLYIFAYTCNIHLQLLLHIIAKYVPEKDIPIKLGIYAKYLTHTYRECMQIYMPYIKSVVPTIQQGTLYFTFITEKYGCHIKNVAYTANMLHKHVETTVLHIYARNQLSLLPHVIAKNISETNMLNKLNIYAKYINYLICTFWACTCHIWSMCIKILSFTK